MRSFLNLSKVDALRGEEAGSLDVHEAEESEQEDWDYKEHEEDGDQGVGLQVFHNASGGAIVQAHYSWLLLCLCQNHSIISEKRALSSSNYDK